MRRYMLAMTALIGAVAPPYWAAAQVAPADQEPERGTTREDIVGYRMGEEERLSGHLHLPANRRIITDPRTFGLGFTAEF